MCVNLSIKAYMRVAIFAMKKPEGGTKARL